MLFTRKILLFIFFLVINNTFAFADGKYWDMPPLPQPDTYGNILINRFSEAQGMKAVFFSHWSHRVHYTCNVCHQELEFSYKVNDTEITEEENRSGLFCGACHDGKIAFDHSAKNCDKCHSGRLEGDKKKFNQLAVRVTGAEYGNKIDWLTAVEKSQIRPRRSVLLHQRKAMEYGERLELQAEWSYVPPAFFPHESHSKWLDCGDCHPGIFNIKKKSTKHFRMEYILGGKFCGSCHLRVAFPIDNCNGCHPDIDNQ